MRISECDVLIVPGLHNSDEEHWQSRWESRLVSASRVVQADWSRPDPDAWAGRLRERVEAATRPVVLVAHSLGVLTVVRAAPLLPPGRVIGSFLVAVPDPEKTDGQPPAVALFAPAPTDPLPFPSLLVASRNDPHCSFERAQAIALDWGAALVDAGESGHINAASGHGPWPEGLMRLGHFLGRLG
ncbi:RBBP9/YdeN family alpha/beta hydrolase [Pseudochelatococcus sp. B33]